MNDSVLVNQVYLNFNRPLFKWTLVIMSRKLIIEKGSGIIVVIITRFRSFTTTYV